MIEFLKYFADSQTNDTPYGKHDFGEMSVLRDLYLLRMRRIIAAVLGGSEFKYSSSDESEIIRPVAI